MSDGTGVKFLTFIRAMAVGKWPFLAPTKNKRDEANMAPFNAPKVEQATKKGIVHDITPSNLSPNVYNTIISTISESLGFNT